MRPFGCPVTILNTIDHLGKFDGKADEGFFIGKWTNWLFDIDALTKSMNYKPVVVRNQSNGNASAKACDDAGKARMETVLGKYYILLPLWTVDLLFSQISKSSPNAGFKPSRDDEKKVTKEPRKEGGDPINVVGGKTSIKLPGDLNIPALEDIVYSDDDEDVGAEADMNNLDTTIQVSPIPTTRIHKDHPVEQIIGDLTSAPQTRRIKKEFGSTWDKDDILLVQVYVDDIIFGSTKKSLCTEFEKMMHKKFQMSSMGELTFFLGLQVKQKENGIFISQDKYVTEILKKFGFTDVKTASTPMETQNPLLKDEDGEEVDVYLYRSMTGSLMYLTSSRPNIMFAVCACARYQVNPKVSHLHVVKRIFRYLKGQPKLGLWYPKDSPFALVAYTDSDYAGASLDMKSTTGGYQFIWCRLISWQCKKHTVVANSTTKAEYVAASSCCGQVLWIQNQLLDYAHNFMHTKIYIDNEKANSDDKIHTDKNVADLLTKAFNKGIGVNVGDSKLMLLGINLLLLGKVNAARHNLLLLVVKTVNGEQQLQALMDRKKIIITEATVRRDLQLEDADGIDCLLNATIFEQLTLMGFVQVFLDNQLEGMLNHNRIYIASSHTKKVFANIKRKGKDFSGRVTPLFSTMMVQAQQEQGEGSDMPNDPHHKPTIIPPSTSQPQRKQRPRKPKRKDTKIPQSSVPMENVADKAVYEERDDSLERATTTATGLDAEQDRGNIFKTQSKATPNEPSSIGTSSGGGPRR
ncbi:uncharacterized mitochondrial protein-like protein [Tanacetum coccineum]